MFSRRQILFHPFVSEITLYPIVFSWIHPHCDSPVHLLYTSGVSARLEQWTDTAALQFHVFADRA